MTEREILDRRYGVLLIKMTLHRAEPARAAVRYCVKSDRTPEVATFDNEQAATEAFHQWVRNRGRPNRASEQA